MRNPFEDKTDEELKTLYGQYKQYQKTGIIPSDSKLVEIRDYLIDNLGCSEWFTLTTEFLLEVIAERWIGAK